MSPKAAARSAAARRPAEGQPGVDANEPPDVGSSQTTHDHMSARRSHLKVEHETKGGEGQALANPASYPRASSRPSTSVVSLRAISTSHPSP